MEESSPRPASGVPRSFSRRKTQGGGGDGGFRQGDCTGAMRLKSAIQSAPRGKSTIPTPLWSILLSPKRTTAAAKKDEQKKVDRDRLCCAFRRPVKCVEVTNCDLKEADPGANLLIQTHNPSDTRTAPAHSTTPPLHRRKRTRHPSRRRRHLLNRHMARFTIRRNSI